MPDTFEEREDALLKKTENKVKRGCGKCGFRYLYDPMKDYPQNCPKCGGSGRSHLVTKPIRR
ncbi:endonuclease Q family protein [Candidatus Woesearchaeota archaeon]|nr:endonuclease Q family protein [Candidatus Woesearchaeota archaeon]